MATKGGDGVGKLAFPVIFKTICSALASFSVTVSLLRLSLILDMVSPQRVRSTWAGALENPWLGARKTVPQRSTNGRIRQGLYQPNCKRFNDADYGDSD